jgi:hypothetical protein
VKVLIVSEGKHERAGAIQTLVARLAVKGLDLVDERVSVRDIHAHHGKGQGYYKKALRWLFEAARRGHDALILVVDEDGRSERVTQIDEAQDAEVPPLPRAFGVAIRTFDAWMLADEQALTEVLELEVQRQSDPEGERHPKRACEKLLESSSRGLSQSEMYAGVADRLSVERLSERCPRGFAPFASRVRDL